MPTTPTTTLLFSSASTALVQVQASIDSSIAVAGTIYQNLGLLHKTTILDVRHELATLAATLDQFKAHINDFPADDSDGHQVLALAPRGVAVCAAQARSTAALKSISKPVSAEDGAALLASYKEVETKASDLFGAVTTRSVSFEAGIPGLTHHGLTRLDDLFHALTHALVEVLPPSINPAEVHEIHANIKVSADSSLSHLASIQKK